MVNIHSYKLAFICVTITSYLIFSIWSGDSLSSYYRVKRNAASKKYPLSPVKNVNIKSFIISQNEKLSVENQSANISLGIAVDEEPLWVGKSIDHTLDFLRSI